MKAKIRPFDQVLRDINNGRLLDEVTDTMTDVLKAVKATGKAGKVTITLAFYPSGPDNSQVEVRPSIKDAAPELSRPISLFFLNDDCGVQRDDPRQNVLPNITDVSTAHDEKVSNS